jgi:hypothetical protein
MLSDDNSSTFFLRKVEQKIAELALNNKQHSLTQTNNSYWFLTFHCCVCHHTQLQCLYLLLLDYFLINIDKDPENELKNIKNWLNLITIKAINLKLNTLVESVDTNLLTREDNSIQHFIWVIPPFWLRISSKNTISQ